MLETVHILETYVLKNQIVKSIKCDFILGEDDRYYMVKIASYRLRFARSSFIPVRESQTTVPHTSFEPTSCINHTSVENMASMIQSQSLEKLAEQLKSIEEKIQITN